MNSEVKSQRTPVLQVWELHLLFYTITLFGEELSKLHFRFKSMFATSLSDKMLVWRLFKRCFADRTVYNNLGVVVDIIHTVVLVLAGVNLHTSLYKLLSSQSLVVGAFRTSTSA